jgi:hypothetical protein
LFYDYNEALFHNNGILVLSVAAAIPFLVGFIGTKTVKPRIIGFLPGILVGIIFYIFTFTPILIPNHHYNDTDVVETLAKCLYFGGLFGVPSLLGTLLALLVGLLQKWFSRRAASTSKLGSPIRRS